MLVHTGGDHSHHLMEASARFLRQNIIENSTKHNTVEPFGNGKPMLL
jgi:hypothetical protein